MLLVFLSCVALGVWQLDRLQWKIRLIAQVDKNLHAAPVPVAEVLRMGAPAAQYRRVSLAGHFDNSKESYVFATDAAGKPVYHVITPFILHDSGTLLVDRGVVPEQRRDPGTRAAGELNGEQRLIGVWRVPDPPGWLTPAPDFAKRVWYSRDLNAIAKASHLGLAAPVLIEADAKPNPGGWPRGGQTVTTFRNEHLQYAITWFGLAAVTFAGWISYHIAQGRLVWRSFRN